MKANGKPPRLRQLRLLREILFMTQPRLLAVMLERYPQVVRWTRASRTTCGKGEVPSLAKEGWPRHQVNGPIPLKARPGWFVQLPIIGGLNQPPRLRPLRRLRGIFLMGAATPPCARRGLRLSLQLSSMPPCPAKDVGHSKVAQEGWLRHPENGWSFQMRCLEPHSKHVSRTDHPVRANFGGLRHHSF